jgi:hypothetical protein
VKQSIKLGRVATDRHEVGDLVVWRDDNFATITGGRRRYGDGPFRVLEVRDAPLYVTGAEWSNHKSMGHTQHVTVRMSTSEKEVFSGAFFRKSS